MSNAANQDHWNEYVENITPFYNLKLNQCDIINNLSKNNYLTEEEVKNLNNKLDEVYETFTKKLWINIITKSTKV